VTSNKTEEAVVVASDTGSEVAVYEKAVAQSMKGLTTMREVLAPGESLDFTDLQRVTVPAGGAQHWELPSGEPAKTITGVIVLRQPVRAYWKVGLSESGGGTPPDCSSDDLLMGTGDNGQEGSVHGCGACPWSKFGTARDEKGEVAAGQACKQITRIFLLREGSMLPLLISVPPSSAKASKRFTIDVAGNGFPLWGIETEIGLEKAQSGGGIGYSKVTFRAVRPIEGAELEAIDRYRREFAPVFGQLPIEVDPEAS
jgi:hypothetical protein